MTHHSFIGSIVDVRFFTTRGKLAADSHEFKKIAFLGRRLGIFRLPRAGEQWQCRVIGDSNPQDATRGALFLQPLFILMKEVVWAVDDQSGTKLYGVAKPLVRRTIRFGKLKLSAQDWSPADKTAIRAEWPDWVRSRVADRFEFRDELVRDAAVLEELWQAAEFRRNAQLTGDKHPTKGFQFQWYGEWLTNGEVWFPKQRPCKAQWREYPIPAIPQECWQMFLEGLEGKFLEEMIPFRQQILAAGTRKKTTLTERQAKVSTLIATHMWKGNDGCKTVSVGRNVIFVASRADGQPVHIVDNPGVGAIYIFADYEEARALATGSVTRTNAIKGGAARIIHIKGWQAKVAEQVA